MARRFAIASAALFVLAAGVQAADHEKAVQQAIKNGQAYLKAVQRGGGFGNQPGVGIVGVGGNGQGGSWLTGLALIESGVPVNDPVVAALAKACRQNALASIGTYEVSLMIMFLDRVGAKEDQGLIQYLTLRLMVGQGSDGTWSYTCGTQLDPVEMRALYAELVKEVKMATPDSPKQPKKESKPREDLDFDKPPAKKDKPEAKKDKDEPKPDSKPRLHPALEKFVKEARAGSAGLPFGISGDHSNTQFATVGLWCGRRHGVDVSESLARLDKHYRDCQAGDGGWAYTAASGGSSPAMTCAGLMGLAMGFGAKNLDSKDGRRADPDAIAGDKNVLDGLKYIGNFLQAAANERLPGAGGFAANGLSNNLYFMWSLERVGMVYGLTTIGKVDWYDWGSKCLVASQQRDGSWPTDGFHSGSPENATAFALLFLCKANLAEDLTTSLKNKVKDPGTSTLKSGDLGKLLEGAGKPSSGPRKDVGTTRPKDDGTTYIGKNDQAGRMAAALVKATGAEREALITKYRDTVGGEHTDALARAASKLTGSELTQVRDALAQRLTRMKATTLNDLMKNDPDRELRRAAALAAGSKGKEKFPEYADALIKLIADDEPVVVQAARASLKALTDKDFGPEAGTSGDERRKAYAAWKSWWDSQRK
jgi:hypothetical protein